MSKELSMRTTAKEIANRHYVEECERLGLPVIPGDVAAWVLDAIEEALRKEDSE